MINPRHFQRDLKYFHLNSGLPEQLWRTKKIRERWELFCKALSDIQFKTDFTAHAFVLMDTHFHILFSTRSCKEHILAEEFHQKLKALSETSENALDIPVFCEPILSAEYYKNAYKYIYRNPVTAGICKRVEDYEYSSLSAILGVGPEAAPVIDNMGLIYSSGKVLTWLNQEDLQILEKLQFL